MQKDLEVLKAENDSLKSELEKQKNTAPKTDINFVQFVKFKSTLPDSEVVNIINSRRLQFLEMPGLVQKYYMWEKASGDFCGIYFWASEQDFLNYRQTELGKTISLAYKLDGKPRVELFEMLFPLRKN